MTSKRTLIGRVIRGGREFSLGTVLFHQRVGQLLGVNATDMKCLDVIAIDGSASPSALAQRTGLSTGATTAMIDRLERARLVERRPHPEDRRGTVVILSRKATRELPPLFASLSRAMEAATSTYSEAELETLVDFFDKAGALWTKEREKLKRRAAERARRAK